ncbi:type II toxin-antitoxin system ParD family antitoxin [Asticcacaulis sp. ZE23SCel15]|uniref:type II toxin-antitoxin system ParD family antitoxin n=1 Tax=Asticcacaulis sp. ZE23SCel15 TaxID=3059027 RepID=UPI00265FE916|nr:type II toxin-antitoxin system ParD family antitoxin [Asticcacaulis sp. ZE23SCel15]WKL59000.1 type II toxin-antitoxin system ParD family antitoxin [Asticcacaulis sp. ZE23SCel15]
MAKISISMTDGMNDYVQARVKAGEYNNTSEYFRDLVRRDQENAAKYTALKQAIQDGLDSGISPRTPQEIMQAVKDRIANDPLQTKRQG